MEEAGEKEGGKVSASAHDAPGQMVMAPAEAMGHGGHAGMSMDAMVRDMRNRFLVALLLSIPIVLWSPVARQVLHFGVPAPFGLRDDVFQLLLSLPVIFYSAWIFFDGAVRALHQKPLDMMELVAVAVGSGWIYSLVVTIRGDGDVFYEAATVLTAFVLLGHWFEMRARGGANDAIRTPRGRRPSTTPALSYPTGSRWVRSSRATSRDRSTIAGRPCDESGTGATGLLASTGAADRGWHLEMAETVASKAMRRVSLQTVVSRRWGDVLWSQRQDRGALISAATRSPTGRLYMQVIGFEVSRALRVELGSMRIREGEARTPVYWEAETQPRLFPTMRGELVAAPAARDNTQLTLTGEYRPPLGLLGRLLDHIVGFRIAQDTLRHFLEDVARQLETEQLRGD